MNSPHLVGVHEIRLRDDESCRANNVLACPLECRSLTETQLRVSPDGSGVYTDGLKKKRVIFESSISGYITVAFQSFRNFIAKPFDQWLAYVIALIFFDRYLAKLTSLTNKQLMYEYNEFLISIPST